MRQTEREIERERTKEKEREKDRGRDRREREIERLPNCHASYGPINIYWTSYASLSALLRHHRMLKRHNTIDDVYSRRDAYSRRYRLLKRGRTRNQFLLLVNKPVRSSCQQTFNSPKT